MLHCYEIINVINFICQWAHYLDSLVYIKICLSITSKMHDYALVLNCACLYIYIQGASANWWNHRHFQHHAKPNVVCKDPDVNMLKVLVLGNVVPVEVNKTITVFILRTNRSMQHIVYSYTQLFLGQYMSITHNMSISLTNFTMYVFIFSYLPLLQYGTKKLKHMPYNHQHKYFFLGRLFIAIFSDLKNCINYSK